MRDGGSEDEATEEVNVKDIEEEMERSELQSTLEQLHAKERQKNLEKKSPKDDEGVKNRDTRSSAPTKDLDSQMSTWEEARRLKDDGVGDGNRQMLDLDSLAFMQGAFFMANKGFEDPDGSYVEIHVPALEVIPLDSSVELLKVSSMPDWAQPAFKGLTQLNRVQSKVYETALFKPDNLLLCAPAGAGKTNVAVLTILQQIVQHINPDDGSIDHSAYKIVYMVPVDDLVAEVVGNLSHRLQEYNVNVRELSEDQSLTGQQIKETQIVVTTPEKWDIITRKWGELTYTQLIKLYIIDEIHLFHDNRGPVLESIVARIVRQIETTKNYIRLVGLSASLPNYEDVALFLRVERKKGLFYFGTSSQQYIGIKKPLQRLQLMNNICYEKVMAVAGKHQVHIFVHSEEETAETARAIKNAALVNETLGWFIKDSASRQILRTHSDLAKGNDLKDLLPYGFAIHHAGMTTTDRQLVEKLFADGHVQVLVSTATLAWGVILPAHTVIIKGTQIYIPEKRAWTELGPHDVMKMLGRAGRHQYDSYGEEIIVTSQSELRLYYSALVNHKINIESKFLSKLADHLNAEIVLGTVQNAREACKWIGHTYLYFRMLKNPSVYGLATDVLMKDKTLEERRADLIHKAASILDRNNLVKYDRKNGYFQVTDLGQIAAHYCIKHETMSTYNEHLKPTMGDIEVCRLFSLSEEFKCLTLRQDEKMELEKLLNDVRVHIPINLTLEEPSDKIIVLLKVYILQLEPERLSLSLTLDMDFITKSAGRLLRALFEIVLKRGWARLAEKALNLCKMLSRTLRGFIHKAPKLKLLAHVQPITRTVLRFALTVTPDFEWDDTAHGYVEPFWVIVEDNDGEYILHHEYFLLKKQYIDEDHTLTFTVPIHEPLPHEYFIRVVSDRWPGSQIVLLVPFTHLILPETNPPPTKLLDLQPLPVTSLHNQSYEALYQDFMHFNPVQTQVFKVLYDSDDNVLVAAPTGSGKTICAEFAILRCHKKLPDNDIRVVYVAPVEALSKERYRDWEKKFGIGLKLRVVEFTGEAATDSKRFNKGQIIICTSEKFAAVSRFHDLRHWGLISLFIIDEFHLIGGQGGPVLEAIVSRMSYDRRCFSTPRIVALSTSLANAKDLGEWIGATSDSLFNFPPSARPVPLEISVQGVYIANFEARIEAMAKLTYNAITQHAKNGEPAIVFVPSRKHVWLTAADLIRYSCAESGEKAFSLRSTEEMEPFLDNISEEMLKVTLREGVGYLHEGSNSHDHEIVSQLFNDGWIQVCVLSSSLCWGVTLSAHLVVVMGTQYYDGRENAQADYPLTVLLHMMGQAGRPLVDNSGKCVIFCHAPRKECYKFLCEAFPVESNLCHSLHDILNREFAEDPCNKKDAVEYLTRTFMYRRLTQNPNYYRLQGVSDIHVSDHLSILVENAVRDLEAMRCVDNRGIISTLKLGEIAISHNISYTTIGKYSESLTPETNMESLLEVLCSASEFSKLPIRQGEEEEEVRRLINLQRFSLKDRKDTDPEVKAHALLQAHFSRKFVCGNLASDQRNVLVSADRLLKAIVDVALRCLSAIEGVVSKNLLSLTLLAIKVNQMLTQGMWDSDSVLLQLPHFTRDLAWKFQERGIETLMDFVGMEDDERDNLLNMSDTELWDIAEFISHFPIIEVSFSLSHIDRIFDLFVDIEWEERDGGTADARRYPNEKEERWWLILGDTENNVLDRVKIPASVNFRAKLRFYAPADFGVNYILYLTCDSYMGCDQEHVFTVDEVED